jgi:predicted TIM-barrel fold metal-dependent hydrolase
VTIDRRRLLAGIGATACAPFAARAASAQPAPYRIDVHYHIMAPEWLRDDAVRKRLPPGSDDAIARWTPAGTVEDMDRNRIATVLGSPLVPGVWFGDVAQGRRLARAFNEYVAQINRQFPGRFGLLATVPLPDTEGSIAEIAYALDTLGADGISLFTSYDDRWLGDTAFDPVFAELGRRKAVVFVHPASPVCCRALIPGLSPSLLEYATDTTRAIVNIAMSGTARRYPDIRFIFSHAGGTVFSAVTRFDALVNDRDPAKAPIPNGGLAHELARHYYEISNSASPINMFALDTLVPRAHVLLGTDSPLGPTPPTLNALAKLGLPPAELRGIERDNALALFPRLGRS